MLRESRGWTHERAAAEMGISRSGFIKLERGERKLSDKTIARAAQVFGVPPAAILSENPGSVPVVGRVGAGALISPEYDQVPQEGLFTVDLPFPIPDEMIAFEVDGESMLPAYRPRDVIVCWRDQRRGTDSFIGEEAAVRTGADHRYLKTILSGPRRGLYSLSSFNSGLIEGVEIVWVGEIYVIVRAGQVRRIEAANRDRSDRSRRRRERAETQELPLKSRR